MSADCSADELTKLRAEVARVREQLKEARGALHASLYAGLKADRRIDALHALVKKVRHQVRVASLADNPRPLLKKVITDIDRFGARHARDESYREAATKGQT